MLARHEIEPEVDGEASDDARVGDESRNPGMIEVLESASLQDLTRAELGERAAAALEGGGVVHLPRLGFEIAPHERPLVDPARPVRLRGDEPRNSGRPTLLYYQRSGRLRGGTPVGMPRRDIKKMLNRFADWSGELVHALLPGYKAGFEQEFTTFRPCARTQKQRLHMDAAIARPTQGRCMLRVFTNVNGAGVPRVWQVGGHFQASAEEFAERIPVKVKKRVRRQCWMLHLRGASKGPATDYDHAMRRLRNLITEDRKYQKRLARETVEFPVGSTWLAFTDIALHGAMSGQHSLDQTFLMDTSLMRQPEQSSLRVLEKLTGRRLV